MFHQEIKSSASQREAIVSIANGELLKIQGREIAICQASQSKGRLSMIQRCVGRLPGEQQPSATLTAWRWADTTEHRLRASWSLADHQRFSIGDHNLKGLRCRSNVDQAITKFLQTQVEAKQGCVSTSCFELWYRPIKQHLPIDQFSHGLPSGSTGARRRIKRRSLINGSQQQHSQRQRMNPHGVESFNKDGRGQRIPLTRSDLLKPRGLPRPCLFLWPCPAPVPILSPL